MKTTIEGLTEALFDEAGDALFLFDPDTDVLFDVNPMAERLAKVSREDLMAQPATYWFRYGGVGGKNRLRQVAAKSEIFHSQDGYFLRTLQDGVWVPVNLTVARLHVRPKPLALIVARDAREQRDAYTRLKLAETELRQVLDSVSDCLWSAEIDPAGSWTYRYFSPVVEKITNRKTEYFLPGLGRWESIVEADDRARWRKAVTKLRTGESSTEEYRVAWPDGAVRWVRESVRTNRREDGRVLQLHGVLTDITERKNAEEEVHKVNAFLNSIVDNIPIMLFVKNAAELKFELLNKAFLDFVGYTLSDMLGKTDFDFFPEAEAKFFTQKDREVLEGRKRIDIPEEILKARDGLKYMHTIKIPLFDEKGQPSYLVGICEDITERKALEETKRRYEEEREQHARVLEAKNSALEESERRYRSLTEATLDAIIVTDDNWLIELFNPAAEKLFGYPASEIVGQPISRLLVKESWESFHEEIPQNPARLVGKPHELQGRRKDDNRFALELVLSVFQVSGQPRFLSTIRDLTERDRIRTYLHQNEKLASIGRLSAGIAHEINNPLAFVANNLVVLDRDCRSLMKLVDAYEEIKVCLEEKTPEKARAIEALAEEMDLAYIKGNLDRLLKRTLDGVHRVGSIVKSLRGHARLAPAQRQETYIPDLFESSLEIVQTQLKQKNITVERDYRDAPKIRCISSDLSQVLLNLIVNASQAIESCADLQDGKIVLGVRREGDDLLLEVTDNGCGIKPEDKPRLFDPFFTTKDVREGTGLGLWISHSIIAAHGGRIEVDSKPGAGASFRVYLPIV